MEFDSFFEPNKFENYQRILEIDKNENGSPSEIAAETNISVEKKPSGKRKSKIVKSKIAKAKQQIRGKDDIVSFQCFMQGTVSKASSKEGVVSLRNANLKVKARYIPVIDGKSGTQLSLYGELSKVLESGFHYSRLTSRSDINIENRGADSIEEGDFLDKPTYLLSRLEVLKNVDIFLGNEWVLERGDLLMVYPYHVHLKNYVNSFRVQSIGWH